MQDKKHSTLRFCNVRAGLLLLVVCHLLFTGQAHAQYYWEPTAGFNTSYVQGLAINSKGDLFAATSVGLFRSTNRGASWSRLNVPGLSTNMNSVFVDADDAVWVGEQGNGIFMAQDNGEQWTSRSSGLGSPYVYCFATNKERHLFVGTSNGIFRSVDQGRNWVAVNNGLTGSGLIYGLAFNSAGHLFAAAASDGMFRSYENGDSWQAINNYQFRFWAKSVAISATDEIFVGANHGLLHSQDNGDRWVNIFAGNVTEVAINSQGTILCGGSGVYVSTNGGSVWIPSGIGLGYVNEVTAYAFHADGQAFVGTWGYGVSRSTQRYPNWEQFNAGLLATAFRLVVNSRSDLFAGAASSSTYRLTKGSTNWEHKGINGRLTDLIISPNDQLFASFEAGGVYYSDDDGEQWTESNNGLHDHYVNCLALSNAGQLYTGTQNEGVFLSTDNGDSWQRTSQGLGGYQWISSIAVDSSGNVYAAGRSFELDAAIFRLAVNATRWQRVSAIFRDYEIKEIAIRPSGEIFVGGRPDSDTVSKVGTFRCVFANDSLRFMGLLEAYARNFLLGEQGRIWLGTEDKGVFRSVDNGASWQSFGLTDLYIDALVITEDDYLIAAGSGYVFRSRFSATAVQESESSILPESILLQQNHPNPFNPSTTIRFSLPLASFVTLKIYNLLGEEVVTLINERRAAGEHRVQWQAHDLPSGVYVYRLQQGEHVESKKLLLLR